MNKNLRMLLTVLLVTTGAILYAQPRTVKGQVTDVKKEPLPGVTILVKGTDKGTITDMDGKFAIEVSNNDNILTASFIS